MVDAQKPRLGGRPSRAGTPSHRRVFFRVTSPEYDFLRRLAQINQQPMTVFIRDVVNEAAAECGERRGLKRR